jgi:hypothetical protein
VEGHDLFQKGEYLGSVGRCGLPVSDHGCEVSRWTWRCFI